MPTFPKTAAARNVRYNANVGLGTNGYDLSKWALQVTRNDNTDLHIGIDELRQLPRTEIVYEFKCIEGWSQVSWWGGVKFSDFIQHYNLQPETAHDYVGLSTPDDQYYVGIDTPSALHPQTILAYEMNGQPLPTRHGAPLRLIIPVKYGVKNLKRVGKTILLRHPPPRLLVRTRLRLLLRVHNPHVPLPAHPIHFDSTHPTPFPSAPIFPASV